jgi:hypothetical protein
LRIVRGGVSGKSDHASTPAAGLSEPFGDRDSAVVTPQF